MNEMESVARQWKLEAEAARLGAQRLRENTRKDEAREYSSGTVWGRMLVNHQVAAVADLITKTKSRLTQGKAQVGGIHLKDVIDLIEPEVLAAIAAKRTLDLIGLGKDNKGRHQNNYTKVCSTIGAAVEAEGRFMWYEHVASKEWKAVKARYFKPTTGTRQKEVISKTIMKRRGYEWKRWSEAKRVHVGGFLLDCIARTAKWFEHKRVNGKGKRGTFHLVEMSAELSNLREHLLAVAELQAPLAWPMVCEPADWDPKTRKGGYLTNELRQGFSLIRGQRCTPTLGKHNRLDWIEMLNTLQKVGYRVNPVTYKLAIQLEARGLELGSFVMKDNEDPIPRPETDDEEIIFQWRKDRTEQENRNAALKGKRYRTLETLMIARRFIGEDVFYIPWSFDYRGRVYPLVSFMSPQGTDVEKSLYLFKDAQPMTPDAERWLAIHLANTAGHDKLPMDERVQWVKDNEELITIIATDPLSNLGVVESFDDPWSGVAACHEYYHCVILKDKTHTDLPIATDATCSGLQHLSAMTLDEETATLVNVKPGAKPQDAYKAVLKRTLELLECPSPALLRWVSERNTKAAKEAAKKGEEYTPLVLPRPDLAEWGAEVGRKLAKRVVMTVPYAATPHSNRGYIREAILDYEHGREKDVQRELGRLLSKEEKPRPSGADLTLFTKVMLAAMDDVVPGPIRVMQWIKDRVGERFTLNPEGQLEWDTPSGFHVIQNKRHMNMMRIRTQLLGDAISNLVADGETTVNKDKHRNCSAPNFIHSLDAALLHISFAGYDKPFTLIHDSILTTATDMEYMSGVIREKFEEIYSPDEHGVIPLEMFAKAIKAEGQAEHLINRNGLQISDVKESTYFFC